MQPKANDTAQYGHVTARRTISARRPQLTQKLRIAALRTYSSIHHDVFPDEIFLSLKGPDCPSQLSRLYDVIARLMSRLFNMALPRLRGSAIASLRPSLSPRLASGDPVLESADL